MSTDNIRILHQVKDAIRHPYEEPGYPKYLLRADGEALSIAAARKNFRLIAYALLFGSDDDYWRVLGVKVNAEHPDLFCVETGDRIERGFTDFGREVGTVLPDLGFVGAVLLGSHPDWLSVASVRA